MIQQDVVSQVVQVSFAPTENWHFILPARQGREFREYIKAEAEFTVASLYLTRYHIRPNSFNVEMTTKNFDAYVLSDKLIFCEQNMTF